MGKSKTDNSLPRITATQARRLLLDAQCLFDSPSGKVDAHRVNSVIDRLGFVQVDSINVIERAHHLILAARLDSYKHKHLYDLLETRRTMFEHWTHDASIIPCRWFPMWKYRFHKYQTLSHKWWRERLGPKAVAVRNDVLERIEREGPLLSRDFEHPDKKDGESQSWWGWKPSKAALEWLWRTGDLAIAKRINFQKVYDLTARVYPREHALPTPEESEHIDWACRCAIERLIIATPGELAGFFKAIPVPAASKWTARAEREGMLVPVKVEDATDPSKTRKAYALHDWEQRLDDLTDRIPKRARVLCPFDPVIRDRKRLGRLFGFDFAFEGFVPAPKRKFGYYALPVLDGDRFVARLDSKFDRSKGMWRIKTLWWEPRIEVSKAMRNRVDAAFARLAKTIGADKFTVEREKSNKASK